MGRAQKGYQAGMARRFGGRRAFYSSLWRVRGTPEEEEAPKRGEPSAAREMASRLDLWLPSLSSSPSAERVSLSMDSREKEG